MVRRRTCTPSRPVRYWVVSLFVILAAGCSSDSSDEVRITATVEYDADSPNFVDNRGTFSAEGDNICSEGTFSNVEVDFVEEQETNRLTSRYQYSCADGSGIFFIVAALEGSAADFENETGPYDGTWTVDAESGLGEYKNSTGSGTFTGQIEPVWIDEIVGEFTQ